MVGRRSLKTDGSSLRLCRYGILYHRNIENAQEKQREEEEEQKRLKFNKEYESNKVRQQMFDDKEKARAERISRNNERKEEVKEVCQCYNKFLPLLATKI